MYEKAKADGIAKEKLGGEVFWSDLGPLWPEDQPHLAVNQIAEWFASYVYLPKLRDRVVLEDGIRGALSKLDPAFAYADSFDVASGQYAGLMWQKAPNGSIPASAVLVRPEVALQQLRPPPPPAPPDVVTGKGAPAGGGMRTHPPVVDAKRAPRRFYGAVEIDTARPVKAFDAIVNAIVVQLQRTRGAKVTLTLDVEAVADEGFADPDVEVVRDNARQLRFKSSGFD